MEKSKVHGVYLSEEVKKELGEIANKESGGNFHTVMQYAIKYFVKMYKAGRVKIEKSNRPPKLEI